MSPGDRIERFALKKKLAKEGKMIVRVKNKKKSNGKKIHKKVSK